MYGRAWYLACFVVLAGCSGPLEDTVSVSLADLPRETVKRGGEWRRGWRVAGGGAKRFSLPVSGDGCAVRLGVLPWAGLAPEAKVSVYWGKERVAYFEARDGFAWRDERVDLPSPTPGSVDGCSVVVESEEDFWLGPCEVAGAERPDPNVLVVLIDTLRMDHLGCYGYGRDTSPHLDKLCEDGVRFTYLIPQSSWTRPSVASILTSCYPSAHGANDRDAVMRRKLPSLAGALREAGYESHALMMNPSCLPIWNVGVEFDRLVDLVVSKAEESDDAIGVDAALAAIRYAQGRPWLVYAHLMGPHRPYTPPKPYDAMFGEDEAGDDTAKMLGLYDGEIRYTDTQVGRLLAGLREEGIYDKTMVVVVSDHGEQFYEHGEWGHGLSLHGEELRVPLIVKLPGSQCAGQVCDGLVEGVDIGPTILDCVGAASPPRFQGRSFAGAFRGEALAEGQASASLYLEGRSMYMGQDKEMKYIRDNVADREMWFDLVGDPGEQEALTEVDDDGEAVMHYASHMAMLGSTGLNVLILPGSGEVKRITGTVEGKGLGRVSVSYHPECYETSRDGDAVRFKLDLARRRTFLVGASAWFEAVEQESARVLVETDGTEAVRVRLAVDGRPLEGKVYVGEAHGVLGKGGIVKPMDMIADPADFDPLVLPRDLGAYVWYVPDIERVLDDALEPAMVDALKGLGYLE